MQAVREEEVKLREVGFVKRVLSREWTREEVMDVQSGESEKEKVTGGGIGEWEMEEVLVYPSWYPGIHPSLDLLLPILIPHAGSIIILNVKVGSLSAVSQEDVKYFSMHSSAVTRLNHIACEFTAEWECAEE